MVVSLIVGRKGEGYGRVPDSRGKGEGYGGVPDCSA